jgi:putative methionine-R-sulfoxide reductase with GAF domain
MKTKKIVSLRSKFVIFTSLTILAALVTGLAVANYFAGSIIISQTLRLYQSDTRAKAINLESYFISLENDIKLLARSPELDETNLADSLKKINLDEDPFLTIAQEVVEAKPEFLAIAFLDSRGKVLLSRGSQKSYFQDLSQTMANEDSLLKKSKSTESSLACSHIFFDPKPKIEYAKSLYKGTRYMGTVRALVSLEKVFSQMLKQKNVRIISSEGLYLFHGDSTKAQYNSSIFSDLPKEKVEQLLVENTNYQIHINKFYTSSPFWLSRKVGYRLFLVEEFDRKDSLTSYESMSLTIVALGGVILLIGTYFSYIFAQSIVKPIEKLRNSLHELLEGKVPAQLSDLQQTDEISQLTHDSNLLFRTAAEMADFANHLGQGDFEYEPKFSAPLLLTDVLLEMREKIASASEMKAIENWIAEGINLVEETLHLNLKLEDLYHKVLETLIGYLNAWQGALYIVDNNQLVLSAAFGLPYAKLGEDVLEKGENLSGQVWQEVKTLVITDIPSDAEPIASGMGKALPTCIVSVALKAGIDTVGVLELGGFETFKPHQIKYLERVAQIIAVSFSTALNNERNTQIMLEARNLAARLQAQEEQSQKIIENLKKELAQKG